MVGWFAEVCGRRELKVNPGKNKVMVLNGEEGLECEFHVDGIRLEYVSEFKYFGCVLNESGIDEAEYRRKVASEWMVTGAIRSLVNARDLQLECATVESCMKHWLYLFLCMAVRQLMKEKERSRVKVVQMDNLK